MHPKLQQAIVAARDGKANKAQYLLTELIEDEPEQADAWFLLGNLAESDERSTAYLQQTLAIDPNHQLAKQRLVDSGAFPAPDSLIDDSFVAADDFDESVPSWLRDETESRPEALDDVTGLPDWLQDLDKGQDEDVVDVETVAEEGFVEPESQIETFLDVAPDTMSKPKRKVTAAVKETAVKKATPKRPVSKPKPKNDVALTRWLYILIFIAIVVIGFLVYLLIG